MVSGVLRAGLFMILTITWYGCKEDGPVPESEREEARIADVSYGQHERNKMDVHLPAGRTPDLTGVIVFIHGGGFVAGDKSQVEEVVGKLVARGYAVVNINYRLVDMSGALDNPPLHKASDITIHQQLEDVEAAVEAAWNKREEWGMSNSEWFIAGHSAGATLALLHAYGEDNANGRIKAAANWAGLTTFAFNDEVEVELLDPRLRELFYRIVGAEATNENKLAYMAASPYWLANNMGGKPTISVRPEDNTIGPFPDASELQYNSLTTLLNGKGSASTHVVVAGAGHGFEQPGKWDEVVEATVGFFNTQ